MSKAIQAYKARLKAIGYSHKRIDEILGALWTGHRNPTKSEINFGYGAMHYAEFDIEDWLKPDGSVKKWIISKYDGLRYYRSN